MGSDDDSERNACTDIRMSDLCIGLWSWQVVLSLWD